MENSKLQPHDIDLEKHLLCCLMMDSDSILNLDNDLQAEHFYKREHRYIYTAIKNLLDKNTAPDIVTIKNELVKIGKLNESGGVGYLADISNTVSTSANIASYAIEVIEKYKLRNIISKSVEAVERAYRCENSDSIISSCDISQVISGSYARFESISSLIDKYDAGYYNEKPNGITTGLFQLDRMTGGYHQKKLIIIAARPSQGKTSLALRHLFNAAKTGEKTALFSLEMDQDSLTQRMLSAETGIPYKQIKNRKMTEQNQVKYEILKPAIKDVCKNIFINDRSEMNVNQIYMAAKKLKKDEGITQVIIDYVGLMDMEKGYTKTDEISKVTRTLKAMAKNLDLAVIVLSQLNREVDKRPDKRPQLSDLRDSGSIEQDADLIVFILRKSFYNLKNSEGFVDPDEATLIIAKQRDGETGDIDVRFDAETVSFNDKE